MMKPLLTILVAFGALMSTTEARLPLITDIIEQISERIPCLGPCMLANADYILKESNLGPQSKIARCSSNFVYTVENSRTFIQAPGDTNMKWLSVLGNPAVICPKLKTVIGCVSGQLERICGFGVRMIMEKYWIQFIKFLDCDVPYSARLRTLECLLPPFGNTAVVGAKTITFQKCVRSHSWVYTGNRWEDVYKNGVQNNFRQVCSAIEGTTECYLDFVRPPNGTQPHCKYAVKEFRRQVQGILQYINCNGDGTDVLGCFGDVTLYTRHAGPSLDACYEDFNKTIAPDVKYALDRFGYPTPYNIKYIIQALAQRTCESVPTLASCIRIAFWARPACRADILPKINKIMAPTLQYINKVGMCPRKEAPDLEACQCIVDYNIEKNLIGSCKSGPSFYVVKFSIINKNYDAKSFRYLVADIKPTIDGIFENKFGYNFESSSKYKGRQAGYEGLSIRFDIVLRAPVDTSEKLLEDLIMTNLNNNNGYLIGDTGVLYKVDYRSVSVQALKSDDRRRMSVEMMVLIAVVSLIGLLFVICLCICCCRAYYFGGRIRSLKRKHDLIIVPSIVKQPMAPSVNYAYPVSQTGSTYGSPTPTYVTYQ